MGDEVWTLEELGTRVRDALRVDYVPPGSARVRAVPDARTIRYYTTLGLVDRPALEGRTALYGRRQLLQLVAIKRLQADGLSLERVQEQLAGLPTSALEAMAKLPGELPAAPREAAKDAREAPAGAASVPEAPAPGSRRSSFWRTLPPAALELDARADVASAATDREDEDVGSGADADEPAPDEATARLDGVVLAPGVRLVLDAARRLDAEDLRELRRAADALLSVIETRGLRPRQRRGDA